MQCLCLSLQTAEIIKIDGAGFIKARITSLGSTQELIEVKVWLIVVH
jgi:hypothetical protein